MLRSLIGYVRGAGLDARWLVIDGDAEFFRAHQAPAQPAARHAGDGGPLGDGRAPAYERRCARNAEQLAERIGPADVVLLHDPQTAGMIPRLVETGVRVIWRAHIGLDLPNDLAREAWASCCRTSQPADAYVFSRRGLRVGGPRPGSGSR